MIIFFSSSTTIGILRARNHINPTRTCHGSNDSNSWSNSSCITTFQMVCIFVYYKDVQIYQKYDDIVEQYSLKFLASRERNRQSTRFTGNCYLVRSVQSRQRRNDDLVSVVQRDASIGDRFTNLWKVRGNVQKLCHVNQKVKIAQKVQKGPARGPALGELPFHLVLRGHPVVQITVDPRELRHKDLRRVLDDGNHGQKEIVFDGLRFLPLLDG
mmetsp:Transcript_6235/g.14698  ORF Transcript_6235/g.14698 Transcript_6235/m.14698 type:complete len:213 (-) Transcript_6235:1201-1839(-)